MGEIIIIVITFFFSNPQTCLPHILCVITGRGPLKSHYVSRIEYLQMQHIEIITPWFEADDYPRILGCADIGVSLHISTSGMFEIFVLE